MSNIRTMFAPVLLCSFVSLATGPLMAQTGSERVHLIISKPPPRNSAAYKTIKKYADKAVGQYLPLTKSEMWSVSKDNVDALRKAAASQGVGLEQVRANSGQILNSVGMTINDRQKAMIDLAKASKATGGVAMMSTPSLPWSSTH